MLSGKLIPIIPFKYDLVYNFTDSAIAAQQNGKFGIINLKNEIILPFEYDTLYDGGALSPGGYRIIKNGKTILVSGASGFLPAYMVEALLFLNERLNIDLKVIGIVMALEPWIRLLPPRH